MHFEAPGTDPNASGWPADPAALARELHVRPGVGAAARVLQSSSLQILRMQVAHPVLILVAHGVKEVRPARGTPVRARPGQAIALAGNQAVDFLNSVAPGTRYDARWLVFDPSLLDDAYWRGQAAALLVPGRAPAPARLLPQVPDTLAAAFARASETLALDPPIPAAVARQRMLEVMHWLLEEGVVLHSQPCRPSVSAQVRALIAGGLEAEWTADRVARELAMSAATFRRRLAAEATTFAQLLVDARMSAALILLQATARPVAEIAAQVGYASPSRFAVRFRERFGFAPTAVRGHGRQRAARP
ncbi:AraC-like DNA-binding protein [Variovorax sp. TBS-050B]|uniref:helix-turn-helix transcriptional regulator n=1 Tax=Variovorax sp. TBS-050B TaxID=2940551 RepID=UPI002476DC42|nr:helix-turn-helix transcriptional regulator [Variovorax sp. TBS-050B]MDH6590162.1 AraC-like DNA-binding protein [Variovorax sp. TBS-050B]